MKTKNALIKNINYFKSLEKQQEKNNITKNKEKPNNNKNNKHNKSRGGSISGVWFWEERNNNKVFNKEKQRDKPRTKTTTICWPIYTKNNNNNLGQAYKKK